MNALPSFNPPPQSPQARKSPRKRFRDATPNPSRVRVKSLSNPAYAHRRQGLEVAIRLVTYSALSVVGMVTVANLLTYNWSQQPKLQQVETKLKDASARKQKTNLSFNRSFDLQSQQNVTQENSYKFAVDRPPIVIVTPAATQPTPTK